MKKLAISGLVLAGVSSAKAAFTLSLTIGALYSSFNTGSGTGTDAAFTTSGVGGAIGVLVVNTLDAPSFPATSSLTSSNGLTVGSNWGSGFYVMATMAAVNNVSQGADASGGAASYFFGATQSIDLTTPTYGSANGAIPHNFALYWFPNITDTNPGTLTAQQSSITASRAIGANEVIGFYTNTTNPNSSVAGNNPFVTPTSTVTGRVTQARSEDLLNDTIDGGTVQANLNLANTTFAAVVVPEPSTYAAIFGILGLAVAIRRSKKS